MSLDIKFELEVEDWLAFQKFHFLNSKKYKRSRLIIQLIVPFVFVFFTIKDIIQGKPIQPVSLIIFAIIAVIWAIFYPKRFDSNNMRRFKKQMESGDNSNILGNQQINFSEEGIKSSTESSENKLKWNGIVKVAENDNYYFLYNSAISALIIPKQKIENSVVEIDKILEKKLSYSPKEN